MINRILHKLIRLSPPYYRLRALTQLSKWNGAVDPELRDLGRYLPDNRRRIAIDIGANNGVTATVLSRLFKCVHAFEPNPAMIQQWKNVAPANIVAWHSAVSDTAGVCTLNIPSVDGQQLSGWASLKDPLLDVPYTIKSIQVPSCTIDDKEELGQPVDFIKIDVEGHELSVLKGAIKTITRDLPWMVIETAKNNRDDVISLVGDIGYRVAKPQDLSLTSISDQNLVFVPPAGI